MALPLLETPRLLLRPFAPGDAPTVERLAGDPLVADTTLSIPHPYPPGGAVEWIGSHTEDWRDGRRLTLAVTRAGELLGAVALAIHAQHARGELGYWIGRAFWGQGYATEAAGAVVRFGFAQLGMNRIQAHHFTRNPASGRVMQKLGLQLEGIHRQAFRRPGRGFEDVAAYAVLREEWVARGAP
jgi:ribosomal-protein-alanine N-acetyltransferase